MMKSVEGRKSRTALSWCRRQSREAQGVRVRRCPLQSSVRTRVLQEVGGTLSPSISLLG